ncbi:MAG: efflux RND transporter periplasmic adaptor subunit [Armatimonadota bacterium]
MADERNGGAEQEQPERRRRARKRRLWLRWLWPVLIAAVLGLAVWRMRQPAEVQVVHPQKRMIVQTLTASGRVAGAREAELSVDRAGVLVEVLVEEADHVLPGDLVARISSDVESAELRRAEAAVATARAELARARADARTLAPTIAQAEAELAGSVQQAQERLTAAKARLAELLAGGREEERREAEAAVEQARARVAQAQRDVERARSLAESDATATAALERARAAAATAQARAQEAEIRLAQSRRDLARAQRLFDEGVIAEAQLEDAQTVAETAREALDQARAQRQQADVEVENQRRLLEVTREEQLERAQTELEAARQQLAQAEARLELVSGPARQEQIEQQRAEIRSAQAALQAARQGGQARVRSLRLTPVQEAVRVAERRLEEAVRARDAALEQLQTTQIRAQFEGIVTEIVSEPGDVLAPGQAVVAMSEMQWPEVHMEIDEREIAEVEAGQDAVLTADAYPEEQVPAEVARIAPRARTERGIIDVVLRPTERPGWLRTGMTVDASIVVTPREELLVLPTTAVVQSGEDAFVMVVQEGRVRRLAVETGVGGVRGTVIRSGLSEDAAVVREPATVSPGQRVKAVESGLALEADDAV